MDLRVRKREIKKVGGIYAGVSCPWGEIKKKAAGESRLCLFLSSNRTNR